MKEERISLQLKFKTLKFGKVDSQAQGEVQLSRELEQKKDEIL